MIKSMTGYGRSQMTINGMDITVEIKSVNHRYFEFFSRIPRAYGFLDDKIKNLIQSSSSRGKFDCSVAIETVDSLNSVVEVNHSLASGYVNALREIKDRYGLRDDVSVGLISRYPEVLTVRKEQADENAIWEAVKEVTQNAVNSFIKMREIEGEKLKADIENRASQILQSVEFIESRSPQSVVEYKDKMMKRMAELLEDAKVDEQRIITEAAIFADKVAVDEETVRLRSHMQQLSEFLNSNEPIGRKMDFLVQEMNREGNTIGSKSQDVEILKKVVQIKSDIEKIREQVQNIE